jgi:hypothetical protein
MHGLVLQWSVTFHYKRRRRRRGGARGAPRRSIARARVAWAEIEALAATT